VAERRFQEGGKDAAAVHTVACWGWMLSAEIDFGKVTDRPSSLNGMLNLLPPSPLAEVRIKSYGIGVSKKNSFLYKSYNTGGYELRVRERT